MSQVENSSNHSAGLGLSHREKKSLHNNDMCLAEQEIFELTVRFPAIAFEMSGEFRANRGKLATRENLAQQVLV